VDNLYKILKQKLTNNERFCLALMILATSCIPLVLLCGLMTLNFEYDALLNKSNLFDVFYTWHFILLIISASVMYVTMSSFAKHESYAVDEFGGKRET